MTGKLGCVVWLGSLGDLFKCQETHSTALLVWRLAARASCQADGTQSATMVIVLGGREGSARRNGATKTLMVRWRLAARGRCARRWQWVALGGMVGPPGGDNAVMMLQARGAWRCVMPARRSEPSVCLAMWDARQAVLVQWWCTRKSFYTTLSDVHDASLWLGVQLRV